MTAAKARQRSRTAQSAPNAPPARKRAVAPLTEAYSAFALVVDLDTLPVTSNHAYKHITLRTKAGRPYTARRLTDEAQAWRDHAALRIANAAQLAGWTVGPRTDLAVRIVFQTPTLYRADIDGWLKLPLDALKAAIGTDDRYIIDLHPTKRRGPEAVRLTVQAVE